MKRRLTRGVAAIGVLLSVIGYGGALLRWEPPQSLAIAIPLFGVGVLCAIYLRTTGTPLNGQ